MEADDYLEPVTTVGGDGGLPFNVELVLEGKRLEKFTLWIDDNRVQAAQITLTDSDPDLFGNPVGTSMAFEFKAGERIKSLSLWATTDGTQLAGIGFHTDQGNEFRAKATLAGSEVSVPPAQLGEGVCVGAQGSSSLEIDCFGLVFLKPVTSAVITNVQYPDLVKNPSQGISTNFVTGYETTNTGNDSQHWGISGVDLIRNESSWSYKPALYSEYVQLTLPVPYITTGPKGQWALSDSEKNVGTGNTADMSASSEEEWSQKGTLAPGATVTLTATTNNANPDVDWIGKVQLTLQGGFTFSYPIDGKYQGVRSSCIHFDLIIS